MTMAYLKKDFYNMDDMKNIKIVKKKLFHKKLKILLSTSLCLVLDKKSMILSVLEQKKRKLASDNS